MKKLLILIVVGLSFTFLILYFTSKSTVKLAEGLPETPTYPKTKLLASTKNPRDEALFESTFESNSNLPEVSKWYLEEMPKNGWRVDVVPNDKNETNIQNLHFSNGTYSLNISLIRDDQTGKTKIIKEYFDYIPKSIEEAEKEILEETGPHE